MSVSIFGEEYSIDYKDVSLRMAEDICKKIAPKVWAAIYTKHIDAPGSHYGFKAVACGLTSAIIHVTFENLARTANVAAIAAELQKYDYPTYYVSKSLLEALRHTHPPVAMTWADIMFPYSAMVFMMPKGVLCEQPSGDEIMYVSVARFTKGRTLRAPGCDLKIGGEPWEEDRISVSWAMHAGLVHQDVTFPVSHPLEPSPGWIDEKTIEWQKMTGYPADAPDGAFSSYMAGLVANLLLVWQARKELVEHGTRSKKTLGSGVPIHSPSWVGKKYEVIHDMKKAVPTGAHFTELGWRSGHYKTQRCGTNRADSKIILVDPYIAYSKALVRSNNPT